MSPSARLHRRWSTAMRFADAAAGWADRPALFLAGVARLRPFAGNGVYAQLGRAFGAEVAPRVAAAGGHRIGLDLRESTDLIIFEEIFLEGVYPLTAVPFTPDAVVDCGACAGFFTVLAHGRYPGASCHLFEPNPRNLERLQANLARNGIAATVHAAAVGATAGQARFVGEGFGGHLSAAHLPGDRLVAVENLPAFLRELRPGRLLLKIDIEGAEAGLLPVLPDSLPRETVVFLETHHAEPAWRAYLGAMFAAGFRHREIRRRHDAAANTDYVEHVLTRP